MTLINRLTIELQRFGLEKHPLGQILPGIVDNHQLEARRSRRLMLACVLLTGVILGAAGSLALLWQRLDAMSGRAEMLAVACLNPGKPIVTSKAASQVIVTEVQKRKEAGP